MPLSLNQPFLRRFFCHFPLLTPFLEVFAGLTLDQLLKGFSHGFVPRKLTNHYKLDFFILLLVFLHRLPP